MLNAIQDISLTTIQQEVNTSNLHVASCSMLTNETKCKFSLFFTTRDKKEGG